MESAQAKNQALREAGAVVPTSYEAFEAVIKETFEKLVSFCFGQRLGSSMLLAIYIHVFDWCLQAEEGKITPIKEVKPPQIPEDLNSAIKSGKVRAPTHIISTISDDRGIYLNQYVFSKQMRSLMSWR